jgi:RND superfamily putative drug exporter
MARVLARPRTVVVTWLLLALLSGFVAEGGLGDIADTGYSVPGSGSARVNEIAARHIPGNAGTILLALITARLPLRFGAWTQAGALAQLRSDVGDATRPLPHLQHVEAVEAIVATTRHTKADATPDEEIVIAAIRVDLSLAAAEQGLAPIESALQEASGRDVSSTLIGPAVVSYRYSMIARQDLSRAERVALPLTFTMLVIAFLSVIAAALPIVLAAVTVAATLTVLDVISLHVGLSVFVVNTASAVGLGLSIDYALFMVTRFREERETANSIADALTRTMQTAGRAVILSGFTIAASLSALLAVGVGLFSSMAVGGIIASLIAVAAATTLLPATILLLGDRLDRFTLRPAARAARRKTLWRRLAHVVTTHPILAVLASVALLLTLAFPSHSLRLDFRDVSELPSRDPMTLALNRVSNIFGAGAVGLVEIATTDPAAVTRVVTADGNVQRIWKTTAGSDGWYAMEVGLKTGPDTDAANATITHIRRRLLHAAGKTYVGGLTASELDLTNRVAARMPIVIGIAILVAFGVLAAGLRSIIIPLKAMLCSLATVAATLGILVACFSPGPNDVGLAFFVPLFIFVLVFGLSIDYEVFLLSRVREGAESGYPISDSVSRGLIGSGRSITLAGLTVAIVFATFSFSSLEAFRELGVGVAVAVVLDVTVVRCVLVPACVVLLGRWNWWLPAPLLARR